MATSRAERRCVLWTAKTYVSATMAQGNVPHAHMAPHWGAEERINVAC